MSELKGVTVIPHVWICKNCNNSCYEEEYNYYCQVASSKQHLLNRGFCIWCILSCTISIFDIITSVQVFAEDIAFLEKTFIVHQMRKNLIPSLDPRLESFINFPTVQGLKLVVHNNLLIRKYPVSVGFQRKLAGHGISMLMTQVFIPLTGPQFDEILDIICGINPNESIV